MTNTVTIWTPWLIYFQLKTLSISVAAAKFYDFWCKIDILCLVLRHHSRYFPWAKQKYRGVSFFNVANNFLSHFTRKRKEEILILRLERQFYECAKTIQLIFPFVFLCCFLIERMLKTSQIFFVKVLQSLNITQTKILSD